MVEKTPQYTVRKKDGIVLGYRDNLSDAKRMISYLTFGFGPLEVLDPEGQIVLTSEVETSNG